ncbi:hypothetical protein B2D07_02095 [Desulfococcus multivorans]|nr:hypothetical protein B2D07_02065 [Desulfococcus multivorans]AQU99689.1 hypothetical protein B2D07_02095 [Desulfococcus multivorans]
MHALNIIHTESRSRFQNKKSPAINTDEGAFPENRDGIPNALSFSQGLEHSFPCRLHRSFFILRKFLLVMVGCRWPALR